MTPLARHIDPFLDQAAGAMQWLAEQVQQTRRVIIKETLDGTWTDEQGQAVETSAALEGNDLTVIVDERHFLIVDLTLPLAARSYLDDIIASRIDLISPWTRDKAVFGSTLVAEDATTVTVKVAVASKQALNQKLDGLKQRHPRRLLVQVSTGPILSPTVIILPVTGTRTLPPTKRRKFVSLAFYISVVAGALIITTCFLTGLYLDAERTRILSELHSLRASLNPVTTDDAVTRDPVLRMSEAKKNRWPMVEALAQLAATLPDDTYLDAVEISAEDMRIEGQSRNVAELPRIIGQNPGFSDVTFKSPTIKREGQQGDLFELGIKLSDHGVTHP